MKSRLTVAGFLLALATGSVAWGQAAATDASKAKSQVAATPAPTAPGQAPGSDPRSLGPEPARMGPIAAPSPEMHRPPHPIRDPGPGRLGPLNKEKAAPKAVTARKEAILQQMPTVKRLPLIIWDDPAPIKEGQALTARELDAISDVPGMFVFSPPLGYVPPRGLCTLTVRFLPQDSYRYLPTATTAVLSVE